MANPKTKAPQKANQKAAEGTKPANNNTTGKITPTSKTAANKETVKRADESDPKNIPSEMGRVTKELEQAEIDKNFIRADQLKTAKAELMDKANKAGLKPKDFPPGSLSLPNSQMQALGSLAAREEGGLAGSASKKAVAAIPGAKAKADAAKAKKEAEGDHKKDKAAAPGASTAAGEKGGGSDKKKAPKNPDPCKDKKKREKKKYVVYMGDLYDKVKKTIVGQYIGRTSGAPNASAKDLIKKRFSGHHRTKDDIELINPRKLYETDKYNAVRGAEQHHIEDNKKNNPLAAKQINGISDTNKNKEDYTDCFETKPK